jgi:hypothetical protein
MHYITLQYFWAANGESGKLAFLFSTVSCVSVFGCWSKHFDFSILSFSDFTWGGRFVCLFLCVVGIALYAIPIGTLFESFGAVLGLAGDEDESDEAGNANANDEE